MLNWAKQTTTSTSSPFTLSDASGFVPLDNVLSVNLTVYFIVYDTTNEEYASGWGRISAANTLTVLQYDKFWNGTTYDDTNPTVSFTAGTKDVFLAPGPPGTGWSIPFQFKGDGAGAGQGPANCVATVNGTISLGSNTVTAVPFIWTGAYDIDAVYIDVTSAATAGSGLKVGLYSIDPSTGHPGLLVLDSGEIATDSAVTVSSSVTRTSLPPGAYWAVFFNENSCTVRAGDSGEKSALMMDNGDGNPIAIISDSTFTYPTGALDNDMTASGAAWVATTNFTGCPLAWLEAA